MGQFTRKACVFISVLINLCACGVLPVFNTHQGSLLENETDGTSADPEPKANESPSPDNIVIGQPNFATVRVANLGRPSVNSIYGPRGIVKIGSRYYVSDGSNHRILIFEGSLTNSPVAVLGQLDFTTAIERNDQGKTNITNSRSLFEPRDLATDGTRLIVSDSGSHRVLIWNSAPTENYLPADVVIGQSDFFGDRANRGTPTLPTASSLYSPRGLLVHSGKLFIADYLNHRILVYNSIPTTNGASADAVIGQANFTSQLINRSGLVSPAAANGFNRPMSMATDGANFIVSDSNNHRVLIWSTFPAATGADPALLDSSANFAVGQSTLTARVSGASQTALYSPGGILIHDGDLYITDSLNHRVIYTSGIPSSNGASFTGVWGQSDFTSNSANGGSTTATAANQFNLPAFLFADTALWVGDLNNGRILGFDPIPAPSGADGSLGANLLLGQDNFTQRDQNRLTDTNQVGLGDAYSLCEKDDVIVVSDQSKNRYSIYNKTLPTTVQWVIGQTDFNGVLVNQGAAQPSASTLSISSTGTQSFCTFDAAGRLYVSDTGNNRVLVFNTVPTTHGVSADEVLGQTDFISSAAGLAANRLNGPSGLLFLGGKLLVSDMNSHRVLVFDVSGTVSSGQSAIQVLGQSDFNSNTSAAPTQSSLNSPTSLASDGTRVFILDSGYNRVIVHNTIPSTNGAAAQFVIGQANFTTNAPGTTGTTFTKSGAINVKGGMTVYDGHLFVVDGNARRILAFELSALSDGMAARALLGQSSFTAVNQTYQFANSTGTAWNHFAAIASIHADSSGDYIWLVDKFRVIRANVDTFWNYVVIPE